MATNAADPMEQDTDSRTASFDHKRPYEVSSNDTASNAGRGHSTPRKRLKRTGKLGDQDVRDFVPVGANFSKSAVLVDEIQDSCDDDGSQAEISDHEKIALNGESLVIEPADGVLNTNEVSAIKAAPPVNWNAVNTISTKIRTTLGGNACKPKDLANEANLVNGKDDAEVVSTNVQPVPKEESGSHERQSTSESDRGVILNLDYGDQEMPPQIKDQGADSTLVSESRDDNMPPEHADLNDQRDLPPLDQSDKDSDANDSIAASNSDAESNDSDEDSEGQSEDDDAMVQYSNSVQVAADDAEQNKKTIAVPSSQRASQNARTLADLSSHDLNAQLRYFHVTKAPEQIDKNTPVRCLVCAEEGHMAEKCEFLTCSACGTLNQHTTQACPNNAKCGKCREQGHDEDRCPYKLKRMPRHEIICDLCQRNGHLEEDCELIWRTSGRPWESDLAHAHIRLSCYECGRSGHLGNECPSRRPNKPMGTSTWDSGMGQMPIRSTREIKIKGKASQQHPITIDDSEDDRANFYRPRISVPEPVRKGQIRIVTGRHESPAYEPSKDGRQVYADNEYGSKSANYYYGDEDARQPYQQYQNGGRADWREVDGTDYATGRMDARYQTRRSNERRSRSPAYRGYEDYADGDSWPPIRAAPRVEYQDRRPPSDSNIYRPMPSAAHNAWSRRRM